MEKENSTEEEPVGSPAPENIKKHEEEHHDISNFPTKSKSSDEDEMVGPTIEENSPSTTKHSLHNEVDETSSKQQLVDLENSLSEKTGDIENNPNSNEKEEYRLESSDDNETVGPTIEENSPSSTKHSLENEDDETSSEQQLVDPENSLFEKAGDINDPNNNKKVEYRLESSDENESVGPTIEENLPSTTKDSLHNEVDETFSKQQLVDPENSLSEKTVDIENNPYNNKKVEYRLESSDENETAGPTIKENLPSTTKDSLHNEFDETSSKQQLLDPENSLSEKTGDIENDPNNNKNEENRLLALYGTREPKVESKSLLWAGKASVLTKFAKFKSLYAVTSIFQRLSKRVDRQNDSNEYKNIKDVDSSEKEMLGWGPLSLIKIRSQGNKHDLQEEVAVLESPEIKPIKGRIVLYTKLWCQHCKEARLFLRKRKLRYSEINIDVYPSRKMELEEITGCSEVPRVFFNQVLIGGLDELKSLDESGQLEEKIEYVISEGPSPKAPLPPFSGEDDVSSSGVVDELAIIVRKMKQSIVVKDRFYKFRRVTNCFLGSEAVDFLSEDQLLEREGATEFARKLAKELFFRHVLEEHTFEDGNHLYRFLDHDPVISQCQNIPRGIIQLKRQPLVELSHRLRFLLYAILDAYASEDGRHIAYRTIHGSEEFARYLRIAEELQRLDLNKTAKEERLAFFINLYNLMSIHAILVWGHPEGALDRRRLLNDFKYVIGGCAYSLSDIHNGILRANQRPPYSLIKPFRITDKRFKVALPYLEPLIHFALVSGNRSAPALRCYSPKNIDTELMEAARNFLQNGAFVLHLDSMTISVTQILKWYSVDFGRNEVEVLKHAANYLEVEKAQTLLELLDSTQLKVVYQSYDWRLNS